MFVRFKVNDSNHWVEYGPHIWMGGVIDVPRGMIDSDAVHNVVHCKRNIASA